MAKVNLVSVDEATADSILVGTGPGTAAWRPETEAILDGKGTWDSSVVYAKNGVVSHSDKAWLAKQQTNSGDEPGVSSKWMELPIAVDNRLVSGTADHQALVWDNTAGDWKPQAKVVTDARDYMTFDGVTDDTAGFNAAVTDTPAGGTILMPAATARLASNPNAFTKDITIQGAGAQTTTVAQFGAAGWDTDNESGTVLVCEATSGDAISDDNTNFIRVNLRDLVLKGKGDNTRTTTAVHLRKGGRACWRNVVVCNFQTGVKLAGVQECSWHLLTTRGCSIGVDYGLDANQNNVFTHDSSADTTAVRMTDCEKNAVYGGAIQSYVTAGVHLTGASAENAFYDQYFESAETGSEAILLDGAASPDDNRFVAPHFSNVAGSVIDVQKGSGNVFELSKNKPSSITFAAGTSTNRVTGRDLGTIVTDNGDNILLNWTGGGLQVIYAGAGVQSPGLTLKGADVHGLNMQTPGGAPDFSLQVRDDSNQWRILDTAINKEYIRGNVNGTAAQMAFFGKSPVGQQAANADTSGAALADLETEVNEIKAVLRAFGLIAA